MKKIFSIIALVFCSIIYAQQQNPVLDSIQVWNVMPKGNLLETYYDIRYFNDKALDRLAEREKSDTFIVKFFYKEYEGGPQKVYVSPFSKIKAVIRKKTI